MTAGFSISSSEGKKALAGEEEDVKNLSIKRPLCGVSDVKFNPKKKLARIITQEIIVRPKSPVSKTVSPNYHSANSNILRGVGRSPRSVQDDTMDEVRHQTISKVSVVEESDDSRHSLAPERTSLLHDSALLRQHVRAMRLESFQIPLRLILSRLINHSLNRHGLFSVPVDWARLGLLDYPRIVHSPMDLGIIKSKLQNMVYESPIEFASDVRLVFHNAMLYNPPGHAVHKSAVGLLQVFEEGYALAVLTARKKESVSRSNRLLSLQSDPDFSIDVPCSSKQSKPHSCVICHGRTCKMCGEGCLSLEPSLVVCQGPCLQKVRKGSVYYVSKCGAQIWCHKCYLNLPSVIHQDTKQQQQQQVRSQHNKHLLKRDLLKRKSDEEVVEPWVECVRCQKSMHSVCVLRDANDSSEFVCPACVVDHQMDCGNGIQHEGEMNELHYLSGHMQPQQLHSSSSVSQYKYTAASLPRHPLSDFIEHKARLKLDPLGASSITIRILSHVDKSMNIDPIILRHFETMNRGSTQHYTSKAICLFQTIDGLDVCIYCMYVQEYHDSGRVYVAYLDSVDHFRPREARTKVYQEILVSYLVWCKMLGFSKAHIWACPPTRGNSFVFWSHPALQKTPTRDRLVAWYHGALSRAAAIGCVSKVQSLYDAIFVKYGQLKADELPECPPLLEGDYWMDEAVRVYKSNLCRYRKPHIPRGRKSKKTDSCQPLENITSSGAMRVLHTLQVVLSDPKSAPFRQPVNPSIYVDYLNIIQDPMDLGTIHSKLVLGEYGALADLMVDVDLMVSNCLKYNPPGHGVCRMVEEIRSMLADSFKGFGPSADVLLKPSVFHSGPDDCQCADSGSTEHLPELVDDHSPAAIAAHMVGRDAPLFQKSKTKCGTHKALSQTHTASTHTTKDKMCWLGMEVGCSMRRMRRDFFVCDLSSHESGKYDEAFGLYVDGWDRVVPPVSDHASHQCKNGTVNVADARASLLEHCQFRNLQFDTLRRAKCSTAILLQHLHKPYARTSIDPVCSSCQSVILDTRWHRSKVTLQDERELCTGCWEACEQNKRKEYVPIRINTAASCSLN